MVLQVGECLSRFMASLLWMIHRAFVQFRIIKPFMSSPLAPERVIVATGYLGGSEFAVRHLLRVARRLEDARAAPEAHKDVLSFAPMEDMLEPSFFLHLTLTAERYAQRETAAIAALDAVLPAEEDLADEEKTSESSAAAPATGASLSLTDLPEDTQRAARDGWERVPFRQAIVQPIAVAVAAVPPSKPRQRAVAKDTPARDTVAQPPSGSGTGSGTGSASASVAAPSSSVYTKAASTALPAKAESAIKIEPVATFSSRASDSATRSTRPSTTTPTATPTAAAAPAPAPVLPVTTTAPGTSSATKATAVPTKAAAVLPDFTDEAKPPVVPAPWQVVWSKTRGRWYFYNTKTDKNMWTLPGSDTQL